MLIYKSLRLRDLNIIHTYTYIKAVQCHSCEDVQEALKIATFRRISPEEK